MTATQTASVMILASGVAHAVVNAILKAGRDKMSGRALIDGFSALIVLPFAFVLPLPEGAWGWLLGSWATHLIYLVCLVNAFERADMTVAYPILRGVAPALAAAVSVGVFGERVGWVTVGGIGLVSTGVVTVGLSQQVDRRALGWALATGMTIAVYTVIDAQGVRAAPSAASYTVWVYLLLGGGIGLIFALWRGRAFLVAARSEWRPGLAAGVLSLVTYGLALAAYRLGDTPRLAALRETSIVFATGIGIVVLKERVTAQRMAGIGLIVAGAGLLLGAP